MKNILGLLVLPFAAVALILLCLLWQARGFREVLR